MLRHLARLLGVKVAIVWRKPKRALPEQSKPERLRDLAGGFSGGGGSG